MEIPVAEKRSFKCRIFSGNHFYKTDFSAIPVFYSSRVVLRLRACNKDTILDADVVKCDIFFFLKTYISFAMQRIENFGGKTETRQTKGKGVFN